MPESVYCMKELSNRRSGLLCYTLSSEQRMMYMSLIWQGSSILIKTVANTPQFPDQFQN